ncbi:hypothetical protein Plhal304r1_c030g0098701 [Plasmopara halstedii]
MKLKIILCQPTGVIRQVIIMILHRNFAGDPRKTVDWNTIFNGVLQRSYLCAYPLHIWNRTIGILLKITDHRREDVRKKEKIIIKTYVFSSCVN